MSAYGKVTPEIVEKFKEIAPGRVYVGEEINDDFVEDAENTEEAVEDFDAKDIEE